MNNVLNFPTPFKETSPAGTYGYPEPEPFDLVDISGDLNGYSVWVGERLHRSGMTLSNACREASRVRLVASRDHAPITCAARSSGAATNLPRRP